MTIISWIENLIDYLNGKKAWRVILEKLGGMAVTKAMQWVIKYIAGAIGGPLAPTVVARAP